MAVTQAEFDAHVHTFPTATEAEIIAGTSDTLAMSPAGYAGIYAADQTIIANPAIIGLSGLSATAGLVTQTADDVFSPRTLAAPAAGFTITNPAGVAGDPTFVLANDLAGLEGLASTGLAVRSATDTWIQWSMEALRGALHGCTLSNNGSDATNDIDIAAGMAMASGTTTFPMVLAAALTKRLDANWAAGTNQGGRYSGAAITDTTYHVWLCATAAGAVVDVYMDPSAVEATVLGHLQAETGGSGYIYLRRIGSIIREAAALVAFFQTGDTFRRASAVDRSSTSAAASALLSLSVPGGIVVSPICRIAILAAASVTCTVSLGSAAAGSANTIVNSVQTGAGDSTDICAVVVPPIIYSNTSSQVYFEQVNTAGTPTTSSFTTYGWVDSRGRLA